MGYSDVTTNMAALKVYPTIATIAHRRVLLRHMRWFGSSLEGLAVEDVKLALFWSHNSPEVFQSFFADAMLIECCTLKARYRTETD